MMVGVQPIALAENERDLLDRIELDAHALRDHVYTREKPDQGHDVVVPTTAAMGTCHGQSAASVGDHVRSQVQQAFRVRRPRLL